MRAYNRIIKQTIGVIFALLCATTFAYGSDRPAQQEEQDAMAEMKEYTIEQKDAAVAKAQEMLAALDTKMESWEKTVEEKWGELKQSSQENYAQSKEELKKQRSEMAEWLDKMKNSSGEAWDEVKQGFIDGYDAFVESWNEVELANKQDS